jgi:hypothetical protein
VPVQCRLSLGCWRAIRDRQRVSAGAKASPSWSGGRRRPTRCELCVHGANVQGSARQASHCLLVASVTRWRYASRSKEMGALGDKAPRARISGIYAHPLRIRGQPLATKRLPPPSCDALQYFEEAESVALFGHTSMCSQCLGSAARRAVEGWAPRSQCDKTELGRNHRSQHDGRRGKARRFVWKDRTSFPTLFGNACCVDLLYS